MPESVGALEIEIQKSANGSTFNLKELKEEISQLKEVVKGGIRGLSTGATHLDRFSKAVRDMPDLKKLRQLRNILADLNKYEKLNIDVKTNVDTSGVKQAMEASQAIQNATQSLSTTADTVVEKMDKANESVKRFGKETKNAEKESKTFKDQLKGLGKGVLSFTKSIGRISMYRAIRSAIKGVTQALAEGRDNLYQWSKLQKDAQGNAFARSLDKMSSSFQYLKNSIAAAFAPLMMNLAGIAEKLVANLVNALNYISKVIATFMGQDFYYKATYQAKEFAQAEGDATTNAKELKKTLLGIDELNVLDSNNGTGNGSKGDVKDFSGMFTKEALNEPIPWAAKLKLIFDDIIPDFSDMSPEGTAQKIITALGGLIGGAIGFSIAGVPGAIVGTIAGITLSGLFNKLTFNGDKKLSKKETIRMVVGAANVLIGATAGFALAGKPGAIVGTLSAVGLSLLFSHFDAKTDQEDSTVTILKTLFGAGGALLGAVIGWKIGGPKGAAIGATIGFDLTLTLLNIVDSNKEDIIGKVSEVFKGIYNGVAKAWNSIVVDNLEKTFGKTDFLEKLRIDILSEKAPATSPTGEGLKAKIEFQAALHPDFNNTVEKFQGIKDRNATLTAKAEKDKTFKDVFTNSSSSWKGVKDKSVTATAKGAQSDGFKGLFVGKDSTWGKLGSKSVTATAKSSKSDGFKSLFFGENSIWSKLKSKKITATADAKKTETFKSVFSTTTAKNYGKDFGKDFASGMNNQLKNESIKLNVTTSGKNSIITFTDSLPKATPHAKGGHPATGELFYANELRHGLPEMVGTVNHQPTVATNPDIVEAVSRGVANAVGQTIGNNYGGGGDTTVTVYLDGDVVYNNVVKHNQQNTIRTGKNAMAY